MITKKLPKSEEDIHRLADAYIARLAEERRKKETSEAQRLTELLEKGNSNAAKEAAISILKKSCPDILNLEYLQEQSSY